MGFTSPSGHVLSDRNNNDEMNGDICSNSLDSKFTTVHTDVNNSCLVSDVDAKCFYAQNQFNLKVPHLSINNVRQKF